MKRSVLFASKFGLLAVLIFIAILGNFSSAPASQWLPQTFANLALNITYALSFPLWLAHICVMAIFALIFLISFYFSKPLFQNLDELE